MKSPTMNLLSLFLTTLTVLTCSASILPMDQRLLNANATKPMFNRFQQRCGTRPRLVCKLRPTANSTVGGVVHFFTTFIKKRPGSNRRCYVRVVAYVWNLSPGLHGFHIHTFGDLRSTDGKSAGGHFHNPHNNSAKHGFPWTKGRHWGDLGNLNASTKGFAKYNAIDRLIYLPGITGRSIVVHSGPDQGPNYQPSGDAGPRLATCIIGFANPDY